MKMKNMIKSLIAAIGVAFMMTGSVFAAEGNVAKVGNTEYKTIDEAIAAWTNGTTLTLLADVTLSDVVTLKSTEHHILNLKVNYRIVRNCEHCLHLTLHEPNHDMSFGFCQQKYL